MLSLFKKEKEGVLEAQELLFKSPYKWLITISITTLNFLITYNFKQVTLVYLYYYALDIVTTYLILEFYVHGIKVLNKRAPLHKDLVKRVTYQFTAHTVSVIIFSIILNELFDNIFFNGERLSLSFTFYTQDTPLALVFILFLHTIYFALFFMSDGRNYKHSAIKSDSKVKVIEGMTHKFLNTSDIICVYTSMGITYVVDSNYNRFLSEKTLREFEQMVSQLFFRANRQFLVTMAIIDSFKSAENGKLEIVLNGGALQDLSESIIVSRNKASSFRAWINTK